jgi:hypothetical protein
MMVWISLFLNDALPKYLPWGLWLALDKPTDARGLRPDDYMYLPARQRHMSLLGNLMKRNEVHS